MKRHFLLAFLCLAATGLWAQNQPSITEVAAAMRAAHSDEAVRVSIVDTGDDTNARGDELAQLQLAVASHPEDVGERVRLGQMLSWKGATRPQALEVFDQGLQRDPDNVELLLASAEVLSWSHTTRPEALARYSRVLKTNPDEPRAMNGKAQLLAWQGQTPEALELYQRVLAKDPKNAIALRGKAEILNWRGHYVEARGLAEQAHSVAPSYDLAELELARANVGLQRYGVARKAISGLNGGDNPDFDDVRHEINRGLGTYLDLGYAFRQQPNLTLRNAEFNRFTAALSMPAGLSSRFTVIYQPTLYQDQAHGFNSNYFGASLDSTVSDRVSTHLQLGAEAFPNNPANMDGGAGLNFKVIPSTTLKFNFLRQAVEESQLSVEGQKFGGVFFGQVYSNLADLGISYSAHWFDLGLDYTDGVYSGRNLDGNRRYSFDFQAGTPLHRDQPYVRVGYYGNYTSFDHDADFTGGPLNSQIGGYFSPTRFLLNEGVLTVSHRFSKNVNWGMSGGAGSQNVETNTSSFSNAQFASNFETHVFWRVNQANEVRLGYDYLNVFNAFQRNLFRFSWRHYF
jgi:tetratricopeptide (TPR) repeat protein